MCLAELHEVVAKAPIGKRDLEGVRRGSACKGLLDRLVAACNVKIHLWPKGCDQLGGCGSSITTSPGSYFEFKALNLKIQRFEFKNSNRKTSSMKSSCITERPMVSN